MSKQLTRLRVGFADKPKRVDFESGTIVGASLITKGPALGHGAWVDEVMLEQVYAKAAAQSDPGLLVHATHGSFCEDSLDDYLGRGNSFELVDGSKVLGDIRFLDGCDESRRDRLLKRAESDPSSMGLSIVFERDMEAEQAFIDAHSTQQGETRVFISPDPKNKENFRHFRIKELRAVDFVGYPAANPDGMFGQNPGLVQAGESLVMFMLGLSDDAPDTVSMVGLKPETIRKFVADLTEKHAPELAKRFGAQLGMTTCPECGHGFDPNEPVEDEAGKNDKKCGAGDPADGPGDEGGATPTPEGSESQAPVAPAEAAGTGSSTPTADSSATAAQNTTVGAIGYDSAHPKGAPLEAKDAAWSLGDEMSKATRQDLLAGCSFVARGRENVLSAFKFMHHRAGGDRGCVFRALAMATARIDQPEMSAEARKIVREHHEEHYHEYDEKAPWERSSDNWELFLLLRDARASRGAITDGEIVLSLRMLGFDIEADAFGEQSPPATKHTVESRTAVASVPEGEKSDPVFSVDRDLVIEATANGTLAALNKAQGKLTR